MERVETLKIHANYLSLYDTFVDAPPRVTSESTHRVNFVDNFHDMQMSSGAVKAIKKGVNLILYLSRKRHFAELRKNAGVGCLSFRNIDVHNKAVKQAKDAYLCTFVTLTLPAKQQHTDKELTKYCLNPFLSYARKYFKVRYFIWKKELQKNGNLHFHLVTDRFIDYNCLRRAWNRVLNSGKVAGVDKPFDYVDRYHDNMAEFYKDGFNTDTVLNHIKSLDYVNDLINNKVSDFETANNREITAPEYDNIANRIYQNELAKWRKSYNAELQHPDNERWRNPNSTDIDAVKTPAGVSLYVAKYIAKDMEDNPALVEYFSTTQQIKQSIYAIIRTIDEKTNNNENSDKEYEQLEYFRKALEDYRQNKCPILGHLWFKSQTLTPFLKGANEFLNIELDADLRHLIDTIYQIQNARNEKRKAQGKAPTNLIIRSYEKDDNGNNTDKIICTTLLFNVFDFCLARSRSGDFKYPALRGLWQRFVANCIMYNNKRGLYEF